MGGGWLVRLVRLAVGQTMGPGMVRLGGGVGRTRLRGRKAAEVEGCAYVLVCLREDGWETRGHGRSAIYERDGAVLSELNMFI